MARRQSRVMTEETDTELDLTPMLDVVFILLIFFIVTSVFVKEPGVEVVRPEERPPPGGVPQECRWCGRASLFSAYV